MEPTGTAQTSHDVMTSGNKFEPGETVTQPSADNSPQQRKRHAVHTSDRRGSPAETGERDRWRERCHLPE